MFFSLLCFCIVSARHEKFINEDRLCFNSDLIVSRKLFIDHAVTNVQMDTIYNENFPALLCQVEVQLLSIKNDYNPIGDNCNTPRMTTIFYFYNAK